MTSSNWTSVRPWLPPPPLPPPSRSIPTNTVQVLDVTPTAIAISVLVPTTKRAKHPTISIQLNHQPWPHVAHVHTAAAPAPSSSPVNSRNNSFDTNATTSTSTGAEETTVIVYGLDPGQEYKISLDVAPGESEGEDDEEEEERERIGEAEQEELESPLTPVSPSLSPIETARRVEAVITPDDFTPVPSPPLAPPPPYSAVLPPALPNESSLRALLKKIRASSKRTETVLNSSIIALKKGVEKGMKEDQRSKTRIVGLEEAIRKAGSGEEHARTFAMDECERRIQELLDVEAKAKIELELKKNGKGQVAHHHASEEVVEEEEVPERGIVDLAKELDYLNKSIEALEKDKRERADAIGSLQAEIGSLEGELHYLEREEMNFYPAPRSSEGIIDSRSYNLSQQQQQQQQQQLPPPPPSFWRRTPSESGGFGRFFRRNDTPTFDAPPSILPAEFVPTMQPLHLPPTPPLERYPPSSAPPLATAAGIWGPSSSTNSLSSTTARFLSGTMRKRSENETEEVISDVASTSPSSLRGWGASWGKK